MCSLKASMYYRIYVCIRCVINAALLFSEVWRLKIVLKSQKKGSSGRHLSFSFNRKKIELGLGFVTGNLKNMESNVLC
jgi:hypothetical protein